MYQLYNLSVTGPGQFDSTMYIQGNTSVVGSLSVVSSVNLGDSLEVVGDTKLKSKYLYISIFSQFLVNSLFHYWIFNHWTC